MCHVFFFDCPVFPVICTTVRDGFVQISFKSVDRIVLFVTFPDIDKELYGKHAKNLMKTDVKEKDGNYEVAIDLPGFKKDEITAELKDGYLTISAAKGLDKDEKDKEGKYIRRERYAGNMSRSFYVGKNITEKDIHGKYENGILMLDIPKKAPEKKVEEKKFVTIEG